VAALARAQEHDAAAPARVLAGVERGSGPWLGRVCSAPGWGFC
jgi:hypothetical protein